MKSAELIQNENKMLLENSRQLQEQATKKDEFLTTNS
jgi:hypothetical protein